MLVEPRAWRRQLDKRKLVKDDIVSDVCATGMLSKTQLKPLERKAHPLWNKSFLLSALRWSSWPSRCRELMMLWTLFL